MGIRAGLSPLQVRFFKILKSFDTTSSLYPNYLVEDSTYYLDIYDNYNLKSTNEFPVNPYAYYESLLYDDPTEVEVEYNNYALATKNVKFTDL